MSDTIKCESYIADALSKLFGVHSYPVTLFSLNFDDLFTKATTETQREFLRSLLVLKDYIKKEEEAEELLREAREKLSKAQKERANRFLLAEALAKIAIENL